MTSAGPKIFLFEQFLFSLSFFSFELVDLFLLFLVYLLFGLQALLDPYSQLVLEFGLFIADFVGLRSFEVVSNILGRGELPPHFDLLLHLFSFCLHFELLVISQNPSDSYVNAIDYLAC